MDKRLSALFDHHFSLLPPVWQARYQSWGKQTFSALVVEEWDEGDDLTKETIKNIQGILSLDSELEENQSWDNAIDALIKKVVEEQPDRAHSISEILGALGVPPSRQTRHDTAQATAALRRLGLQKQERNQGDREFRWAKTE